MKKALLVIALLFGMASAVPVGAQKVLDVATSLGSPVTSLEGIAALAENGTTVMLYNAGDRKCFIENSPGSSGDLSLALCHAFEANSAVTNAMFWRLEKAEGENNYRLLSLVDNKYMAMLDMTSSNRFGTVSETDGTPEVFTVEPGSVENAFYFIANNVKNSGSSYASYFYLNGNGGVGASHDAATVVG